MAAESGPTDPSPARVAYIVSSMPARWLPFEWICENLDRRKIALSFILIHDGPPPLARFLDTLKIPYLHVPYRGPFKRLRTLRRIYRHLRKRRIELVHAHFGVARRTGLLAATLAGVSCRLYTRHHGIVRLQEAWKPWYSVASWVSNLCATHVVAPSNVARDLLEDADGVPSSKILRIDHGFDLKLLQAAHRDRASRLHGRIGRPIVGVVARYERSKGIQFVIPAFRRLLQDYPDARLLLANAAGRYSREIRTLLSTLPEGSYTEIEFEPDLAKLYRPLDLFVHTPTHVCYEAFGQVYVEALAAGVPSIFTASGIAAEFIVDRHNAHLVPVRDSDAIYRRMLEILGNPDQRHELVANGLRSVEGRFGIGAMTSRLETVYLRLTRGTPDQAKLREAHE